MGLTVFTSLMLAFGISPTGAASAQSYSEGQVWEYKTRQGESGSLLRIAKVEVDPKVGQIFHISVIGVKVRNPRVPAGVTTELPHFPVAKISLDNSVTKLSRMQPAFPDFREGYAQWQRAKGGVFTITVAEIISFVEETIQRDSAK